MQLDLVDFILQVLNFAFVSTTVQIIYLSKRN